MRILALLLACTLAACALSDPPPFPDVEYQCEDGARFRVMMTPTQATVILPGNRRYYMQGTMRRDYARYADYRSRAEFYAGREGAFLWTPERNYRDCWLVEQHAD